MDKINEALFYNNDPKIINFQKAKPAIAKALTELKDNVNFVKFSQLTPKQRKYILDAFPTTLGLEIKKKTLVAGIEIFYYEDKRDGKLSQVFAYVPRTNSAKKINYKKYMSKLEQSNILNEKGEKEKMNIFDDKLFIMDEEFDPSEYEVIIEGAKFYDMRGFFKKYPEIKAAESAVNQANIILRSNGEPTKQTAIKITSIVCRILQVLTDVVYIPACFVGVFSFWIIPLLNRLQRFLIDSADFALAEANVEKTINALVKLKNKTEKESEKEKIQKEIDKLEKVLETLDESYLLPADDQSLEVMQEGLFKKKGPFASSIQEAKPAIAKAIADMKENGKVFLTYNELTSEEKNVIDEIFVQSTKGVGGTVARIKVSGVEILYTFEKMGKENKVSNVIGFTHGKNPYIAIPYRKYMEVKKEEFEEYDLELDSFLEDMEFDLGLEEFNEAAEQSNPKAAILKAIQAYEAKGKCKVLKNTKTIPEDELKDLTSGDCRMTKIGGYVCFIQTKDNVIKKAFVYSYPVNRNPEYCSPVSINFKKFL